MKKLAVVVFAAVCAAFMCRADEAEEVAEVREIMQDALRKMDEAAKVRVEEKAVVQAVFNEGTNSSFITRTELTATQKRFLEMGRRMMQMALYIQTLEARLATLEALENERLERKAFLLERNRAKNDETKEKVRRAIERQQSGQRSKSDRTPRKAGR